MPRSMILRLLLVLAAVVLVISLMVFSLRSSDIRIGVAGPMSGKFQAFGQQLKVGAEQAVADINAAGGVDGRMLTLEFGDDHCNVDEATRVANRMVGREVAAVIGHFCSLASIAASKTYDEAGVIMISPSSTNPKLTDDAGPTIFRVSGRDDRQGKIAGAMLAWDFADRNIAIVHDETAYGTGLAEATKAAMNAVGKWEVLSDTYMAGGSDYSALVRRLQRADVQVLYLGGYSPEAGIIVRELRDRGMQTVLVGGDALVTPAYWQAAGTAGEGTLMTFLPDPRRTAAAADVVERLRAEGVEPEGYVLHAYGAVQAWAQAASEAGSIKSEDVARQLHEMTFDTVLGAFTFDQKGDVSLPSYVWYVWKDGKYDYR